MTEKKVSIRYAKAIFEVAKEREILERCYNDMVFVKNIINSHRELRVILKSPVINKIKKKAILDNLFKQQIHEMTFNFFDLLTDKQREALIVDVIDQYIELYYNEMKIQIVDITSANELTDTLKQKITAKLTEITGKTIKPNYSINTDIKGGLLLKMDNWVYDATIARQLHLLKEQLIINAKF
ncbi:MAG TPA: ATP synthase F1 subunit delta [Candidatus Kapabacteria bacterium]|nr:ATP synthase F1 subunit delta [Candidatus Kapabacteria bacterium]